MPFLMRFGSWVLNGTLGYRSLFSLGRYDNEFIQHVQIISFFEQCSFKLRHVECKAVGIVVCYSHQACCLLYYSCEISNNGIHIYLSGYNCEFGFDEKYWRIDGFSEKKAQIVGYAYPYSTPLSGQIKFNFASQEAHSRFL